MKNLVSSSELLDIYHRGKAGLLTVASEHPADLECFTRRICGAFTSCGTDTGVAAAAAVSVLECASGLSAINHARADALRVSSCSTNVAQQHGKQTFPSTATSASRDWRHFDGQTWQSWSPSAGERTLSINQTSPQWFFILREDSTNRISFSRYNLNSPHPTPSSAQQYPRRWTGMMSAGLAVTERQGNHSPVNGVEWIRGM